MTHPVASLWKISASSLESVSQTFVRNLSVLLTSGTFDTFSTNTGRRRSKVQLHNSVSGEDVYL